MRIKALYRSFIESTRIQSVRGINGHLEICHRLGQNKQKMLYNMGPKVNGFRVPNKKLFMYRKLTSKRSENSYF